MTPVMFYLGKKVKDLSLWMCLLLWMGVGCAETAEQEEAEPIPQVVTTASVHPNETLETDTQKRFQQVIEVARTEQLHQRPIGQIMQAVAEQLLGVPYVGGMLDEPSEETLVVSLEGFDCVLYVEAVLAFARGIALQDYSFEGFERRIQEQRYRDGVLNGYCSRLHYFTEWISDNDRRGVVETMTQQLGGERFRKTLSFMGTHRESYPRMIRNNTNYQCILGMEDRLATEPLYHIPQDQIATLYNALQPGDIVAMTTNIKGLDVTHSGLVYAYPDGKKGFIHASISGEVKISPDLQKYVQDIKSQVGIVVARPVDPR